LSRVVRVVPDLTAVDRAFDYTIDDDVDAPVGTIVRVPLHGRRVRGWIVATDVEPETRELLAVQSVVGAGPSPDVVELSEWVAHRWCGPRVAVLRSASAPNLVRGPTVWSARAPIGTATVQTVVRTPPLLDRRALVAERVSAAGSTIVCVADAGRSRALAAYLRDLGRTVALVHSFLSDAERTDAWRRAAGGECVVVGGRIAALAPVPDLRAAVVVDDADEALQEERAPTWHARDVLEERARRAGAPFVVVSPAPTVDAIVHAGDEVKAPTSDVERNGWPRVQVVDRREEPPGAGLLTDALASALRNAGGPAVCVLNRRGRFRLLACGACGHLVRWDRTDARPAVCPECGASKLRVLRSGVTRVREELEALVPGRRVVDVDAATTDVPDADIAIGTEAVLHRAAIRRARPALVAYLDLDQELLAPRYRAATQAHWLVTRGAQLLATRPRTETMLLLQTRIPEHVVVQAIVHAAPALVAASETEYRTTLGYPPFGAIAELHAEAKPLDATIDALRALDVQSTGVQVFGPTDDRLLVVAPDWAALAHALEYALPLGRALGRVRAVVDPPRV
jgi:primosomal protein N' (replication factor Y)